MSKIREAMKWLGIKDVRPLRELVYERMVRIAKKDHRTVCPMDLRSLANKNKITHALTDLRSAGRVEQIGKGKWIPLP